MSIAIASAIALAPTWQEPTWSEGDKQNCLDSTPRAGSDRQAIMQVEVLGEINQIEIVAAGRAIRELSRLRRVYGQGRWRKLKGIARVRVGGGPAFEAEIHWYEASGVGRKEFKIKRILG